MSWRDEVLDTIAADVVVIAHTGLDQYGSFSELATAVPLRTTIDITAWRIPANQIPKGDRERIAWLDEQWVLVDQRIARLTRLGHASGPCPLRQLRAAFDSQHGSLFSAGRCKEAWLVKWLTDLMAKGKVRHRANGCYEVTTQPK